MTGLAGGGTSADRPKGYINGTGTQDSRPRRRAAATSRPSDHVPSQVIRNAGASPLPAAQLAQYRRAIDQAVTVQEIWRDGMTALVHEGMAQLQEAGERAVAAGQAMAAAAPEERVELALECMLSILDRMLANSATVLDLMVRPHQRMLDLLAAPADEPGAPAETRRAA